MRVAIRSFTEAGSSLASESIALSKDRGAAGALRRNSVRSGRRRTFVMTNGKETDYLRTWADMVDWFSLTELSVDPGLKLSAVRGAEALKCVAVFRQAWKAELAQIISGDRVSGEFIGLLNRLLADTFHEKLDPEGKNGFRLVPSISQLHGKKLALAILGRQIVVFLVESNLSYLHRCANTTSCRLYFYDTTKNHRRQWCSAATCGNRHKVAQFRKRQAKING